MGERYLDTVYNSHWVEGIYGDNALTAAADRDAHVAA
jgi:hypothetical protein